MGIEISSRSPQSLLRLQERLSAQLAHRAGLPLGCLRDARGHPPCGGGGLVCGERQVKPGEVISRVFTGFVPSA